MSRITHFKQQPKSVYYWDYYILCRLNVAAAIALQRLEYWDGTKDAAVAHAEAYNDAQEANNQPGTQDTSRWVYKAQDELQWELMGITGERGTAALLKFLQDDMNYLASRNNPDLPFDRKKQYEFQAERVQEHLNYLTYIIGYFQLIRTRLNLVYYAIELLTREHVYIEELSVAHVLGKLAEMRDDPKLPKFLKNELTRDKTLPSKATGEVIPFRNIAEWKVAILRNGQRQDCGMDNGKTAESIPQDCGSNSSNYNHSLQTVITNQTEEAEELGDSFDSEQATATTPPLGDLSEKEIALVLAYRQQVAEAASPPSKKMPLVPAAPTSKQAATIESQPEASEIPSAPTLARPASDAALTDEIVVQLWEYLRNARYDDLTERGSQIRAARKLLKLRLPVPLSVDLLERVYTTFFDSFWKQKYGELHVGHLVDTERSGKIRIVRWLSRLQAEEDAPAETGTAESLNGANGHVATVRMVMWKGRQIPEAQAYQEGYEGGFERFKKGDHPDDDLAATLKRLQAEGRLPTFEEAQVSNG